MTTEIVYSPVEDRSKDIAKSPIWKNAWYKSEIDDQAKRRWANWFEYRIRFDGLKPIQLLKMERAEV
jgi:hypothetical protein